MTDKWAGQSVETLSPSGQLTRNRVVGVVVEELHRELASNGDAIDHLLAALGALSQLPTTQQRSMVEVHPLYRDTYGNSVHVGTLIAFSQSMPAVVMNGLKRRLHASFVTEDDEDGDFILTLIGQACD